MYTLALFCALVAPSYTNPAYGSISRSIETIIEIEVINDWYELDGMSLGGSTKNMRVSDDNKYMVIKFGAVYWLYGFINGRKEATAASKNYEFCITLEGVCMITARTGLPAVVRLTLFSNSEYSEGTGTIVRPLQREAKIGIAIRNIQNTDNFLLFGVQLIIDRVD